MRSKSALIGPRLFSERNPLMPLISYATHWQDLANDLLRAIDQLEEINRSTKVVTLHRAILITVADDLKSMSLTWCRSGGGEPVIGGDLVRLEVGTLPETTEVVRSEPMFADPVIPPNASIDRAVSKAANAMLSWTTDPETLELLTHQRYHLFLCWAGGQPKPVYEYAYGLWDE
jgi:hypothetical protein